MKRSLAVCIALSISASPSLLVGNVAHASTQRMTVKWSGDCRDGEMAEDFDDDDCTVSISLAPRSPQRIATLEAFSDDGIWTPLAKRTTRMGKASFEVSAYDEGSAWLNGTYKFRVSILKTSTKPALRGRMFRIDFAPAGDETAAAPVKLPSTQTTSAPTTPPATTTAPTTSTTIATTTTIAVGSSRSNPHPFGMTVTLSDSWTLQVASITADATQSVLDENMFNDPPATGKQFFIARVRATYIGSGSKRFDGDFRLRAVGQSAVTYSTFENSCGVIPDDLPDALTFTGGSIEGNVCWEILSSDATSLLIYDSPFLGRVGNFMALR